MVVTMFTEHTWNCVAWFFLVVVLGIRVGIVVPLWEVNLGVGALWVVVLPLGDLCVAEINLDLGAGRLEFFMIVFVAHRGRFG